MKSIDSAAILFAVLLAVSANPALAQEAGRQRVEGTDVSMVPPRDFQAARKFSGFENPKAEASILVTVLPAGIGQFIVGLTDERMKAQGMTVLSREKLQVDRSQALLLGIAQDANDRPFRKWMLVFGDSTRTALIVATFPGDEASSVSRAMKDAVLTARFGARDADSGEAEAGSDDARPETGAGKKLEGVPFRITPAAPLKLAEVINKAVMLTRTGRYPIAEPGDPFFIAAGAIGTVTPADRKDYATKRLAATATVRETEVEAVKEVTIDGLPGFEIVAKAKHDGTDTPLLLYQVMLFTEDSYFLMQGIGLRNADPSFLEPFRKTAESFRR